MALKPQKKAALEKKIQKANKKIFNIKKVNRRPSIRRNVNRIRRIQKHQRAIRKRNFKVVAVHNPSQELKRRVRKILINAKRKIRNLQKLYKNTPKGPERFKIKRKILKYKIIRGGELFIRSYINHSNMRIQKYKVERL
jgi:hypothetical protein